MDFDKVLVNRRTARDFTNDTVTKEQLNKILYSGTLAPSAKNRQPWKFYILNNKQKNHIMNMLLKWDNENVNKKTSIKGSVSQIRLADKMLMIYSDNYKSASKMENYKKPDYISVRMCNRKYEFASCRLGTRILYSM